MRNKDIPAGIVASRLGYPIMRKNESILSTYKPEYLLRGYSDAQLATTQGLIDKSAKHFNKLEAVAKTAFAASTVVSFGLVAEHLFNILNTYKYVASNAFTSTAASLGIDPSLAYAGVSGLALVGTALFGGTSRLMAIERMRQSQAIDKENLRRTHTN